MSELQHMNCDVCHKACSSRRSLTTLQHIISKHYRSRTVAPAPASRQQHPASWCFTLISSLQEWPNTLYQSSETRALDFMADVHPQRPLPDGGDAIRLVWHDSTKPPLEFVLRSIYPHTAKYACMIKNHSFRLRNSSSLWLSPVLLWDTKLVTLLVYDILLPVHVLANFQLFVWCDIHISASVWESFLAPGSELEAPFWNYKAAISPIA